MKGDWNLDVESMQAGWKECVMWMKGGCRLDEHIMQCWWMGDAIWMKWIDDAI